MPPLARAVDDFLAHRRDVARMSANTVASDATFLREHLVARFGDDLPADAVDAAALQALFGELVRAGYAPSTVLRYKHSGGAFFDWLSGGTGENPARAVVVPELPDADARCFSDEELVALREAADRMDATRAGGVICVGLGRAVRPDGQGGFTAARVGLHAVVRPPFSLRLALELGVGTGGREAELAALGWGAFRSAERTVRFTHQVARWPHPARAQRLVGLKGKVARVTLVLPEWWAVYARRCPAPARGRVLAAPEGTPPTFALMAGWINRLYDAAGLNEPGLGWHALRHTYARRFIELGGRLEELQKSLGHQSIVTTEQTYGHLHENTAASLARRRIYGEQDARGAPRVERGSGPSGPTGTRCGTLDLFPL